MQRVGFNLLILSSLLVVSWFCLAEEPGTAIQTTNARTTKPGKSAGFLCQGTFIGSRSCSSTACHGSVLAEPDLTKIGRNEFQVWLEGNDPHRFAHRGLTNKLAVQIFTKLGVMKDGRPVAAKTAEYRQVFKRCAACHNPQSTDPPATQSAHGQNQVTSWLRDGVSCEACHGPAKKWVGRHYKGDFIALTAKDKCKEGMVDTGNLWVRAKLCSSCHVGSPERHVDHDLIAAGHPQLKFEFVAYQAILPKHWRDTRDRKQHGSDKNFALRMWITGQLASAHSSLQLLEHRAKSSHAVWPEFSETDCYACHHDLGAPSNWRKVDIRSGSKGLRMPWSSWQMSILDRITTLQGADTDKSTSRSFASWEKATQVYLGLRSIDDDHRAAGKLTPAQQSFHKTLNEIRDLLAFPTDRRGGFDSPKKFFNGKQDKKSPRDRARAGFQAAVKLLKKMTQ
jgi:hypothetical protein